MSNKIKVAMRGLVMAVVLIGAAGFGSCAVGANLSASGPSKGTASPSAETSMLTMVHIRASSSGALKQLRAMPIDIIRVRPDPQRPADENSLAGGIIVEAVMPKNLLPTLKAKGFDVSEVPPKK